MMSIQEDVAIVNIEAPKYIKQLLVDIKAEINSNASYGL